MEFEPFSKIPRLRRDLVKVCGGCKGSLLASKITQRFCGKKCRETTWATDNRSRLNEHTRRYRSRRYAKEGRWRDESPKAKALAQWMAEIKSAPCADCGQLFQACCMDFDYRVGTTKSYNVGSMFAHHYARELIEVEIAKCDLVCANCHRIRTRDRRIGNGKSASI